MSKSKTNFTFDAIKTNNMKTLLPNRFKIPGAILLLLSSLYGVLMMFFDHDFEIPWLTVQWYGLAYEGILDNDGPMFGNIENNLTDEFLLLGMTLGGLFFAFSKEKIEDEYIARVRMESFLWANYISYIILIIATFTLFNFVFLNFLLLQLFMSLFLFIGRFYWSLRLMKKDSIDEE